MCLRACKHVEEGNKIERCNFSSTLKDNVLERVIDRVIDESTSNTDSYFAVKMISGNIRANLVPLSGVKNKVTDEKNTSLNTTSQFEAKTIVRNGCDRNDLKCLCTRNAVSCVFSASFIKLMQTPSMNCISENA